MLWPKKHFLSALFRTSAQLSISSRALLQQDCRPAGGARLSQPSGGLAHLSGTGGDLGDCLEQSLSIHVLVQDQPRRSCLLELLRIAQLVLVGGEGKRYQD